MKIPYKKERGHPVIREKNFLKVAYQDPLVEFVQSVSIGRSFPCRLTQFSSRLNNDTHGLYITLSTAIIGGEKKERKKTQGSSGPIVS